jgi:hypothetical protein
MMQWRLPDQLCGSATGTIAHVTVFSLLQVFSGAPPAHATHIDTDPNSDYRRAARTAAFASAIAPAKIATIRAIASTPRKIVPVATNRAGTSPVVRDGVSCAANGFNIVAQGNASEIAR